MGSDNGGSPDVEIGVKELTKTFGSQTVWEDLTCDIPKGKITVMLGPSGTGKSVFLKHIMGLLKPDHGEIWIDGKNIPSLSERDLYKVRRKFGVLFQDGALFGSMSVYDNTAFPLREHTRKSEKEIRQIVIEKLEMVGLRGAEKKLPGEISGGMKKRAGLARALVLDPDIVMFDEPDSGLDPVRTAFLSELIRDLNAQIGMTSVVVTHDIATTRRVADYIGMIARQHLVKFGTAKEMFESDHPVVRQFLAGDTEGPIGMAEEKDEDILGEGGGELPGKGKKEREGGDVEAKSSSGMSAEETEDMERAAGAPDEDGTRDSEERDADEEDENVRVLPAASREDDARDERDTGDVAAGEAAKQGSGLPEGFSLEQMLREGGKEERG